VQADAQRTIDCNVLAEVLPDAAAVHELGARDAIVARQVGNSFALCALGRHADGSFVATLMHAPVPADVQHRSERAWLWMEWVEARMQSSGVDDYDIHVVGGLREEQRGASAAPPADGGSIGFGQHLMEEASTLARKYSNGDREVRFASASIGVSQRNASLGTTDSASVCVYLMQDRVFYVRES